MKKGKENYKSNYIRLYSFAMQNCKAVEIHSKEGHSCFQKWYCSGSARGNQKQEELQSENRGNDRSIQEQRTNVETINCALLSPGIT